MPHLDENLRLHTVPRTTRIGHMKPVAEVLPMHGSTLADQALHLTGHPRVMNGTPRDLHITIPTHIMQILFRHPMYSVLLGGEHHHYKEVRQRHTESVMNLDSGGQCRSLEW